MEIKVTDLIKFLKENEHITVYPKILDDKITSIILQVNDDCLEIITGYSKRVSWGEKFPENIKTTKLTDGSIEIDIEKTKHAIGNPEIINKLLNLARLQND